MPKQSPLLSADLRNTRKSRNTTPLIGFLVYCGLALALLLVFCVAKFFFWARCFDLHAFLVPSGSMCPTLCLNERIIAGMDAFNVRAPKRGEVILLDQGEGNTKFIKRVIGSDTVAPGPSNTLLVNNTPLALPPRCGENTGYDRLAPEGRLFETVKVPEGSLFVIGDNLDNSYDSRHFGFVGLDKVRGKALLIYWSSSTSRIGCKLD
jgi:signal peptidase I